MSPNKIKIWSEIDLIIGVEWSHGGVHIPSRTMVGDWADEGWEDRKPAWLATVAAIATLKRGAQRPMTTPTMTP